MSEKQRKMQWILGDTVTAPPQDTILVQYPIPFGKRGYILGFCISTTDQAGNAFQISWRHRGQLKTMMLVFGGQGTVKDVDNDVAINEAFSADAQSYVTIRNMNVALAGDYQASLLIGEEAV